MPTIGMHLSIAGGLTRAVDEARMLGCGALQIFARNPRGWHARALIREEVREFRAARDRAGLHPLAVHSVYLINLCAQDPGVLARSRLAFRQEIERSLALDADYLVIHPGSPGSASAEAGITCAAESVRIAVRGLRLGSAKRRRLMILFENTAGQGSSIGCTFGQLEELLKLVDDLPVGVCLDTAHTLAAGYDISTARGLVSTVREIEQTIGFDRIRLIHCNDSKAPMGSRVDRHEHIGLGYIGDDGFRRLRHNLKFRNLPFILETPKGKVRGDEWNLTRIRELSR